jgi:hypothetical protein
MKTLRFVVIIFVLSCSDFAIDPISNVFSLSKSIVIVNEEIEIDPSSTNQSHFVYDLLFQPLGTIAEINTIDSLTWDVQLKQTYFSMSSNDLVESEDIYFSYKQNENRLNDNFDQLFKTEFKRFEKVNESEMKFEFRSKIPFDSIIHSDSFYVYSKHNSTFNLKIGTGNHTIILNPKERQYVIMPFVKFIHTQTDSIEQLYWINSSLDEIKKNDFQFDLPPIQKFKELRNYEFR